MGIDDHSLELATTRVLGQAVWTRVILDTMLLKPPNNDVDFSLRSQAADPGVKISAMFITVGQLLSPLLFASVRRHSASQSQ